MLIRRWHGIGTLIALPTGIIMPFNDVSANIPTGWEHFTAADDKSIKGVSSGAGVAGGSLLIEHDLVTDSAGLHAGSNGYMDWSCASGGTGSTWPRKGGNSGSHAHTVYTNFTPSLARIVLMRAIADHDSLPVDAGLISLIARSGLDDITPTGNILNGAGLVSVGGTVAEVNRYTTSSNGSHHHFLSECGGAFQSSNTYRVNYTGVAAHSHNDMATPSVTDSIRRFYMGLYTSATRTISANTSTIGMWESDTPPEGWVICDGTNGTPNLVDHFIGFDVTKLETFDGDGTIESAGGNIGSTAWSHTHNREAATSNPHMTYQYHFTYSATHSHTVASKASSFEPEHYTLIFIKPIG